MAAQGGVPPRRNGNGGGMDDRLVVLFPGQGSQTEDMRDDVEAVRPDLIELARAEVGEDPFERVEEGTRWQQPAIFCAALTGWDALSREAEPALMAGHSLGEIAALVAAGALSEEDGLRLVTARGRLMEDAADAARPGGMLAVRAARREVEEPAARHGLTIANENSPRQIVLSGEDQALASVASDLEEQGVKTRRLSVSGAFHSAAMAPAVPRYRDLLDRTEIARPSVPVYSCVTAQPFDDIRRRLAEAICRPVRWLEVLRALYERGARRYVETGPGKVVTGLVRRSLDGVEAEAFALPEAAHV
jgi:[acyl-carrier-protein] S-malonyltransferase